MTELVERLLTKHVYGAFEIEQQRQEAAAEIDRLQEAKRRALKLADERAKEANRLRQALETIASWRFVDIRNEYEHGLRDVIRSITDCAQSALDVGAVHSPQESGHD